MPERLPVFINPEHAATHGLQTSGELSLAPMSRLQDHLLPPYGDVQVSLEFGKKDRHAYVRGKIQGNMVVQCQRCMQAMNWPVDHQFQLGLVKSESEIDALMPGEEPLMIGHEEIRLSDIIEDELELLLPMVVMHEADNCKIEVKDEDISLNVSEEARPKSPFAVLADFKKH